MPPLGRGTGLELIDHPGLCGCLCVALLSLPGQRKREPLVKPRHPLPGIPLGIHLPFSLPPSLHHSSGKHMAPPCPYSDSTPASLGLADHTWSSSRSPCTLISPIPSFCTLLQQLASSHFLPISFPPQVLEYHFLAV